MKERITLPKPQDWHCHFRDGDALLRTVPDTVQQFAHALAMPNLVPPITTVTAALHYRDRILAACPDAVSFSPKMTLYLTDTTTTEEIEAASACEDIVAVKLYPAGATTNSDAGVQDWHHLSPIFAKMEEEQLVLCIHGEVTDPTIDIFHREAVFIDKVLAPLLEKFPRLPVVLEHITTQAAVEFVQQHPGNMAATITAHHLLANRNHMLAGGIRPHLYCLPILKTEQDRQALLAAATSGNPRFFLGTDSAPHAKGRKESACGCAGIYTAHAALALYATAFEQAAALDRLPDFASRFGAAFYGIAPATEEITLIKETWQVPESLAFADDIIIPFAAGQKLNWRLEHDH